MITAMRTRVMLAACLVIGLGWSDLAMDQKKSEIPNGTWGGLHVRIEVGGGSAAIEYDCAHGAIDGPLTLDSDGHFSLSGTHVREHGGPVRIDEKPNSQPAQYTGTIDGDKMSLTVTLTETKETIGTFTLERGNPGRVFKCR
jgi:hypothetical protein